MTDIVTNNIFYSNCNNDYDYNMQLLTWLETVHLDTCHKDKTDQ